MTIVTLATALWCEYAWSAPLPQLIDQGGSQLESYRNVKSYVDRSVAELMTTVPELEGLKPVASKGQGEKALKTILDRVGKNVQEFFARFPDTTSHEHIAMERLGPDGKVEYSREETFRYMAVARTGQGVSTLEEYRTGKAGQPVQPTGLAQGLVVTKGFASAVIYFAPELRSEAFFRYLGRQNLGGKDTDVVAFAQRPGLAQVPVRVNGEGRTANLLVQGLAWIDPGNYEIVRMRTDLLAPCPDVGLMGETTAITFGDVRFPEKLKTVLSLPREVTVTINWVGKVYTEKIFNYASTNGPAVMTTVHEEHRIFRNVHRYSDYKLFGSKSKLKF